MLPRGIAQGGAASASVLQKASVRHAAFAQGVYHVIFHLMFGCETCGAHAFSTTNGSSWVYTGECYNAAAQYTDHPPVTYPYCERPHLVMDERGEPVALTNGVKIGPQPGMANDDQSFTLLRPLNTAAPSSGGAPGDLGGDARLSPR
eukprot:SAG11_NODE_2506_length_3275_cov_2.399559_3_plen_147_part_00